MLNKSAKPECRRPWMNSEKLQPPIWTFMEDLTVKLNLFLDADVFWGDLGLEKLMVWAHMQFKPAKSRFMALRKGKVGNKVNIAGTAIPTILEKPVKSLDMVFASLQKDATSINLICTEVDGWFKSIDKSRLSSIALYGCNNRQGCIKGAWWNGSQQDHLS